VRVVPAFDITEDGETGLRLGLEAVAVEDFALEACEEGSPEGVVAGVAHGAHQRLTPLPDGHGGARRTVIGVKDDTRPASVRGVRMNLR